MGGFRSVWDHGWVGFKSTWVASARHEPCVVVGRGWPSVVVGAHG